MKTNERVAPDSRSGGGTLAGMGEGGVIDPAARAVTDVRAIVEGYRSELRRWLEDPASGDSALLLASRSLCDVSMQCGMLPEQILIAVHPDGVVPPWTSPRSASDASREARYRWAIRLLLRTYFGLEGGQDSKPHSAS